MPEYVSAPITTDVDLLEQEAYDYIAVRWPNWVPSESNFEAWLIGAVARMVAEARDVASDVPTSIFRYFGASIMGIPPIDATTSTVASTWALKDSLGHTIEAGTLVAINDLDGVPIAFEVVSDVIVPAASSSTAAGEVTLRSIEAGGDKSGLGGVGMVVPLIDAIEWVNTVTLTGSTTGGVDAELDSDYLNRLSARLTLLTPRPILPRDFELLAVDIAAQNGTTARALAIDGWDADLGTGSHEKTITVFMVDNDTGADVPSGVKTAVDTELQSQREVNFLVYVRDPTRTTVDVTFTAKATTGSDVATVEAAAEAAVASYLSPANWGRPDFGAEGTWTNRAVVRYLEVAAVINAVQGIDYVTALTIGLSGGAQTAADHALTGAAPITTVGAIAGTVTL